MSFCGALVQESPVVKRWRFFNPKGWLGLPDWLTGMVLAGLLCLGVTALTTPLLHYFDLVNIALLYLLNVVLVAVWLGRLPAVFAALFGSVCFAHVFVPPHFSLAITDPSYLITALEMLVVAWVTGHLTAGLGARAEEAAQREKNVLALNEFAKDLAGASDTEQVGQIAVNFLTAVEGTEAVLLVLNREGKLEAAGHFAVAPCFDLAIAQRVIDRGERQVAHTPAGILLYFPLQASNAISGVLAVFLPEGKFFDVRLERHRLETMASVVAVTLGRVRYANMARDAVLKAETEQLRSSILAALSHDIRTPLTSVVGLADALAISTKPATTEQHELAVELRDQAMQMNSMVNNLLDMARLQAGRLHLQREWQPLEEVIGSSLELMKARLGERKVKLVLAPDLPLLEFDAALIERVICNLIENASKFCREGEIRLEAECRGSEVAISVVDEGCGVPAGCEERIFEMFEQGRQESGNHPGVGLGLSICRTIIAAHGGTIRAANHDPNGAVFTFTLPVGTPPEAEEAPLDDPGGPF